jgi:hypothetical protein
LADAIDDGHQNGSEEGADVNKEDFFSQQPGETERQQDTEGEENISANDVSGSLLFAREIVRRDQLLSPVAQCCGFDADNTLL